MQLLELNAFPLLYQLCLTNFLSTSSSSLIALFHSTVSQARTTLDRRADYWNQIERGSHHSFIVVIFNFFIGEEGFNHGILMASNPEVAQSPSQCGVLYICGFLSSSVQTKSKCGGKYKVRSLAPCCYVTAVMKEVHCGDRPAQCPMAIRAGISRHKEWQCQLLQYCIPTFLWVHNPLKIFEKKSHYNLILLPCFTLAM